jgi:hypothetical protein|tara:strand:+ start:1233 stop:1409 length:177 start_codon:yes stop_codon:yes gene_type:complete
METGKKISDIRWGWALAQINNIVNDHIQRIESNKELSVKGREELISNAETAWQRIIQG